MLQVGNETEYVFRRGWSHNTVAPYSSTEGFEGEFGLYGTGCDSKNPNPPGAAQATSLAL